MSPDVYEILALRYATHGDRRARDNFLEPPDPDALMPIDYYFWVIRGPMGDTAEQIIVVDTGTSASALARKPGRQLLFPVEEVLAQVGIDHRDVEHVVLSHMHFDHAGRLDLFPNAHFHVQDAEMAFVTGRRMRDDRQRSPIDVDDVTAAVQCLHAGRLLFHDGTDELAPGVTLHRIGGHTPGTQAVRIPTGRGWVVLASDATHLWANIRDRNPFPIVADVEQMQRGYEILESLADGPDHIIPGHDPLVRRRFPKVAGEAVRVDLPPES
jgi:glyoxylase-like metal-dependent hydrolase (beta-lactamase superfamily II)